MLQISSSFRKSKIVEEEYEDSKDWYKSIDFVSLVGLVFNEKSTLIAFSLFDFYVSLICCFLIGSDGDKMFTIGN